MDLRLGFGGLAAVALAGKLAGGLRLRLRHGGGDDGELLSANAGGRKIVGVVGGELFHALEGVRFVSFNVCHIRILLLNLNRLVSA